MGAATAAVASALPRTLQLPLLPLATASVASCPPPAAAHHPHRPAHSHRAFSTFVPPPRPGSTPSSTAAANDSASGASPAAAAAAAAVPPPPRDPNAYSNPNAPSWKRISWKDEERRAKKEERRDSLREEVKQLTGRGMVELYKSGGKPHTTPTALANAYTARPIPPAAIDALTLDEQQVRLPEDCSKYAATFLAVGFNQQTMVGSRSNSSSSRAHSPLTIRRASQRGSINDASVRCFLGTPLCPTHGLNRQPSVCPCSLRAALLCSARCAVRAGFW